MQQSSKAALAIAAALVLALVMFFALRQPAPSDQQQIVAQMDAARTAAVHHDTRGIMSVISADYKGQTPADGNVDELHLLLSRSLGKSGSLDVALAVPSVTVQGDTATSRTHLSVRTRADNLARYDQDVTLHWRREDGTRLLVFPAKVWRIVGANFPAPEE